MMKLLFAECKTTSQLVGARSHMENKHGKNIVFLLKREKCER